MILKLMKLLNKEYINDFTELSFKLIEKLVSKEIRMIGIDSCGVRKGAEHPKTDNFCAQMEYL